MLGMKRVFFRVLSTVLGHPDYVYEARDDTVHCYRKSAFIERASFDYTSTVRRTQTAKEPGIVDAKLKLVTQEHAKAACAR